MTHSPTGERIVARSTKSTVKRVAIATLLGTTMISTGFAQSVDISKWSPEYVRSIAGTEEFDTVGHCNSVTPTDYAGRLTFWYQGMFEADGEIARQNYRDFFTAFMAPGQKSWVE